MRQAFRADTLIKEEYIEPYAVKVVRKLHDHGFETYIVGGCIRDLMLNKKPKDFDIVTSATPNQIRKIFKNSRIIGRRFKINHIFYGKGNILEVSTFRKTPKQNGNNLIIKRDNLYGTPEDDVFRRDFTINGLFYDPVTHLIHDYVGGVKDIRDGIIKMIGDPDIRLQEDPVRILRAIRLSAKLHLDIDKELEKYMYIHRQTLKQASKRRVIDEMWKIMLGENAEKSFELLITTGVLRVVFPKMANLFNNPDNIDDILPSLRFIDLIREHPIASRVAVIPLYIQPLFKHLYASPVFKYEAFEKVFIKDIVPVLISMGFGKKPREELKHILHIMLKQGSPKHIHNIRKKLKNSQAFPPAYFNWQVIWFTAGEIDSFDLNFLINYVPYEFNPPKQEHKKQENRKFFKHKKQKYFSKPRKPPNN